MHNTDGSPILVIGKNGQLARELQMLSISNSASKIVCLGRGSIDVMSEVDLRQAMHKYAPKALINASAYTAVDKAEQDQDAAFALNCTAVSTMAKACKEAAIPMVHVSTDYVFRGDKGSPYCVDDARCPQGVYGTTKAAGEEALLDILPNACVIRTSWVYSATGSNFVKTMLTLMASRPELKVIDDQVGSPTWTLGLAQACLHAALTPLSGIYHWSDEGVTSWYDFAVAIQELGLEKGLLSDRINIFPIPTKDYPTPAKRPHYSVLDKTLTRLDFTGTPLHHWRAQLSNMLDELVAQQTLGNLPNDNTN